MQSTRIQIAEPCNEKWDNMQPNTEGRHCALCEKTVTDFTNYTNDEIIAYLQAHAGKKICGRMKAAHINDTPVIISQPMYTSILHKIAAAVMMYLGLTSAACDTPASATIERKTILPDKPALTGEVGMVDTPKILTINKDTNKYILGGMPISPTPPEPILMGDVAIIDTLQIVEPTIDTNYILGMMPIPLSADSTKRK